MATGVVFAIALLEVDGLVLGMGHGENLGAVGRVRLVLVLGALVLVIPCSRAVAGYVGVGARALVATDTAHLRLTKNGAEGARLLEEGPATGTLPGSVRVEFLVGPTVSASFTIRTSVGSLVGHGSGKLHSGGLYASFGGAMTVTRGTGRYAHAHGQGGLYGTINRETDAMTVQTTGTLYY